MSLLSITKNKTGLEYYSIPNLEEEKALLLRLLLIVDKIARENNIDYWIDGGTLLGAVRHKGFIPWDDDVDICLLKRDYDRLIPLLYEYSQSEEDLFLFFYKRNSIFIWDDFWGSKKVSANYNGSWRFSRIDITPMKIIRDTDDDINRFKYFVDVANYFIRGKIKYFSEIKKQYSFFTLEEALEKKRKFLNSEFKKYLLEDLNIKEDNSENLIINYSFGDSIIEREREFYRYSDIFPLKEISFEGYKFKCPNKYSDYLKKLYGDYLKLPNVEKRKPYSRKIRINKNLEHWSHEKALTSYINSYNEYFYKVNTVKFKIFTLFQHIKVNGIVLGYRDIIKPFIVKLLVQKKK